MRATFVTLVAAALSTLVSASPLEPGIIARDDGKTIHVTPGLNAISNAIKDAKKGTKIVIEKGEYHEQLTIKKDGISLVGKQGATLYPPNKYYSNACTGVAATVDPSDTTLPETQAGICIKEHIRVASVENYVNNVSVKGLAVKNFDVNILVIGARNTDIAENSIVDGIRYGLLSDGSHDTTVKNNLVTTSNDTYFIAVCMDNFSGARAIQNKVTGYGIAFCTQTSREVIKRNTVKKHCLGVVVDPHIDGVKIIDNSITEPKNPNKCKDTLIGILLDGASNAEIHGNTVKGHEVPDPGSGWGILGFDDPCVDAQGNPSQSLACLYNPSPSPFTGNVITNNIVRKNTKDIEIFAAAPNVVKNNDCLASTTPGALAGTCK
ncbi:hypothetical protein B0A48_18589 [Cryoendolithus antarcticus]|uniref:Periplasmic copper-binding protein NosD beta helix domain-containing protein n=1 Tax=Cryoendolithus antarcticus TaxID=1507870 RepID=A0A1V8S8M7_9PEZI|nr:hypothetical protein B0A48_18589 [Cryoendolithus antarcticus]